MAKQPTSTTPSSTPQQTTATLYYAYDPMCSWCWAFRPLWDALQAALPSNVNVVYLAGGLAPDCDQPMPVEQQHTIQGYWHEIHRQLGTEFNFDFWQHNTPRRSTYMSCRAAIAAANQNAQTEMIDAIQKAYYLRALNPSDIPILCQLAAELGLNVSQFEQDLLSADTEIEFKRQMALARSLPIDGFPSVILEQGGQVVRLQREYRDHQVQLEQILGLLAQHP
jgi:putative protein-disulfide isomerase